MGGTGRRAALGGLTAVVALAMPSAPAFGDDQEPGAQWRTALGAAVDAQPHGVLELGWRRDDLTVAFNTDTLDLRWSPAAAGGGRWWIAAVGEGAIAGLMRTPWTDGSPDPSRALFASHVGLDVGRQWKLPGNTWAATGLTGRVYLFGGTADTEVPVPPTSPFVTPSLAGGWWSKGAQAVGRIAADLRSEGPQAVSPSANFELVVHPHWTIAPRLELRAGVADGQDQVNRTRLGGVVPYSVPVAGTSWAEWWVEDFAAARAGVSLRWSTGHLSLLADTATFEPLVSKTQTAEGFGVDFVQDWSPWRLELAGGYAPWVPRGADVARFTTWVRVTRQWSPW